MGCGAKSMEEEQIDVSSMGEGEHSKDDLSGLWSDHLEFMDRTVSFVPLEDPSHPRVTEPNISDYIFDGNQDPDDGQEVDQEETHLSPGPVCQGQELLGGKQDRSSSPNLTYLWLTGILWWRKG